MFSREPSLPHYFVSLAPWIVGLKSSRVAVLQTLWASQPDPFALQPRVIWTQPQLSQWTKLCERTVRDCLRELKEIGAISRFTLPRGGVGYHLNRHPDAETDPRFGPFEPLPVHSDENGAESKPASSGRGARRERSKEKPQRFPEGVRPSDVAQVLTAELGGSELSYKGPEVRSAGEAMVAHGWDLDVLEAMCRAYGEDPREDKPPPRELFFARHRETTAERYGGGVSPPTTPPTTARAHSRLSPERLRTYLAQHVELDEAQRIVTEHGARITAMEAGGLRQTLGSWKAQPEDARPALSVVFAELFAVAGGNHGR